MMMKNVISVNQMESCEDFARLLASYPKMNVCIVMKYVMEGQEHIVFSCSWMSHDR